MVFTGTTERTENPLLWKMANKIVGTTYGLQSLKETDCICIYLTPPSRAECDSWLIIKRSNAVSNLEFFFS